MSNASNTLPRPSLSTTTVLQSQTAAEHAHKDRLWCTKGLLRNRDMTLGRFLTRQGLCLPSTYEVTIHCFLQKMLETRATFPSRDATQLVTFPWHLLCLHHGRGSGRSHQFSCLAELQPQRLLLSSEKGLYFSAKKKAPAPQSLQVSPTLC